MPTRLYIPSSGAAAVNPSTVSVGWDQTTGAVGPFAALIAKISSAITTATVTPATGNDTALSGRWVYGPIAAQNISGTLRGVARVHESSQALNALYAIAAKVIRSDGVDRGILVGVSHSDAIGEEVPLSADGTAALTRLNMDAAEDTTIGLSPVDAEDGDFIVIELGFGLAAGGANSVRTCSVRYGDSGPDFDHVADDDTDPASPWVEFSGDIAPFVEASGRQNRHRSLLLGTGLALDS